MIDNSLHLNDSLDLDYFLYSCWNLNYFCYLLVDVDYFLDYCGNLDDLVDDLLDWYDFLDYLGLDDGNL